MELALQRIERVLVVFEQQQHRRALAHDLAADLAPDRAPGTGHQHHLADDVFGQQNVVGRHRLAPQQVVHIQFVQIGAADAAVRRVAPARQRAQRHPQRAQGLEDLVAARALQLGHGQQHRAHPGFVDQCGHIGRRHDRQTA